MNEPGTGAATAKILQKSLNISKFCEILHFIVHPNSAIPSEFSSIKMCPPLAKDTKYDMTWMIPLLEHRLFSLALTDP